MRLLPLLQLLLLSLLLLPWRGANVKLHIATE